VPPTARDPVLLAMSLTAALVGLVVLALGVRTVLSRRLPRPRLHFGGDAAAPRPGPMRLGGSGIFLGAGILLQQAALLLPMARGIRMAVMSAALLASLTALAWLFVRRD
jgi:hypothetical protein